MDPRTKAKEDVREAFRLHRHEPELKRCPRCGHEEHTIFDACSNCGWAFARRAPRLGPRGKVLAAIGAASLIGVLAAIALPPFLDNRDDRREQRAADHARDVAAERARLIREQRPMRGRPASLRAPAGSAPASERLAARVALVGALEADILRDARARIAKGELDGPVKSVKCGSIQRTREGERPDHEDLTNAIGRYDCVAKKRDVVMNGKVVAALGHPFVATVDFKRFTYVWCKNNPPPSERAKAKAVVRLDRACLGATGPALGSGYVEGDGDGDGDAEGAAGT